MAENNQNAQPETGGGNKLVFMIENSFLNNKNAALAVALVAMIVILIFPLPSFFLDLGLALEFMVAVLVLMVAIFLERPLQFNSFPTLLLFATIMNLALNLSSTRLILEHGHEGLHAAGEVIAGFAEFIMGGNFVIGIVIFCVLMLVNFMVITKGSGRIAEVAARFTLDAMPGKQMAIDSDMAQGLIDEEEAKQQRKELVEEGSFFGAMDGAAKFVSGDAKASFIVTIVNIVAGMIIGVAQQGLDFSTAANYYTRLTVGDGLVSNLPSLIISLASGIIVTKAGVDNTGGSKIFTQMTNFPKGMMIGGGMVVVMALLPGLPFIPFFLIGGTVAAIGYYLQRKETALIEENKLLAQEANSPYGTAGLPGPAGGAGGTADPDDKINPLNKEDPATALHMDMMRIELGYGLLPLVNSGPEGQWLTDQIKSLRRQLAGEMGFIMPSVRIQDNMQLPSNTYLIRVKEVEVDRGEVRPNMLLVMDPNGDEINLPGERTLEPTFRLPAMWVGEDQREEALFRNYTVVEPTTVITTHLTEIVRDNMADLLSYAEVQKLIEELDAPHQKLVADIIPAQISLTGVQRVLQKLIGERISIRDLPTILEGIADAIGFARDTDSITEQVRTRISRQICDSYSDLDGVFPMVILSPEWEQAFIESIVGQPGDQQLAMSPSQIQKFIVTTRDVFESLAQEGEMPVLVVSPPIRPLVRSLIERFRAITPVVSQAEIHPKIKIKTLATIEMTE